MTRKQTRLTLILASLSALSLAAWLILNAFQNSMTFFYTPSDVKEKGIGPGTRFRLGGLVEQGSLVKEGSNASFVVTDKIGTIKVFYTGILPDLFREGQGVVAEGVIGADGVFVPDKDGIFAKHDENYMPKDVADKLKEKGVWQEGVKTQ